MSGDTVAAPPTSVRCCPKCSSEQPVKKKVETHLRWSSQMGFLPANESHLWGDRSDANRPIPARYHSGRLGLATGKLSAILVNRHGRRRDHVVARRRAVHGDLDHVVEQVEYLLGKSLPFGADDERGSSMITVVVQ